MVKETCNMFILFSDRTEKYSVFKWKRERERERERERGTFSAL